MSQKTNDAISRSDRVLVAALAIILATASAAIGASLTYHPGAAPKPAQAAAAALPAATHTLQARETRDLTSGSDAVMAQLLAEHKCLTEVMYYEARGEGAGGQKAIAEVVFHRMNHGDFGHSICAVVYEGAQHRGCQFSFACNGDMKKTRQAGAWHQAELLAARIMTGEVPLKNATGGATNFHAISVSPIWADTKERTTQIGNHVFYKDVGRTRDS